MYAKTGGSHPQHAVHALLGNLRTKIFHTNDDRDTNQYAADIIGKSLQWRGNVSQGSNVGSSEQWGQSFGHNRGQNSSSGRSHSEQGSSSNSSSGRQWGVNRSTNHGSSISRGHSSSTGSSEVMDYIIEPSRFRHLASGGSAHNHHSEAMIIHGSDARIFRFQQHYI